MRIPPYFPRLGALALACALALPAQAAERAWSYSYNALGLIERADCVLANLEPFRGSEPDSGTTVRIRLPALDHPDLEPRREGSL